MSFFVAFYSYKGGVGRTLALANVAHSLAERGKRVVLLDMDLEAPSLHDVPEFALRGEDKKGLIEYASSYRKTGKLPGLRSYIHKCRRSPGSGELWLMPAGRIGSDYQQQLGDLAWRRLHPKQGTRPFVDGLRQALIDEIKPHYVLIDARTGLSDVGGLSTHVLADMVVLVFNITPASIEGSVRAFRSFTSEGSRVRFVQLVASPVPPQGPGESLAETRIGQATELMKEATLYGRNLIRIDYHPAMVLAEELAVRKADRYPAAARYEMLRDSIQRANPREVFPLVEEAVQLRSEGRLDEAVALLRAFTSSHSGDVEGHLALGNFLFDAGRYAEAGEEFRTASTLAPEIPLANRRLGEALVAAKKPDEAVEALKRAAELGDQSRELYLAQARAYGQRNETALETEARSKAMLAVLRNVEDLKPLASSIPELRREFIEVLTRRPPYGGFEAEVFWDGVMRSLSLPLDGKLSILRQTLNGALRPTDLRALFQQFQEEDSRWVEMLGTRVGEFQQRVAENAVDPLNRDSLLGLRENSRADGILLGLIAYHASSSDETEMLLRQAVNVDPENAGLLFGLGFTLQNSAEEAPPEERRDLLFEVCLIYQNVLRYKPNKHEAFYNWGIALEELANLTEGDDRRRLLQDACSKYQGALQHKPDKYEALNNWGIALMELAKLTEEEDRRPLLQDACSKYQEALQHKPDTHEALINWGIALVELAKLTEGEARKRLLQEACSKHQEALQHKPDMHAALHNWGIALVGLAELTKGEDRKRLLQEAGSKYHEALQHKPDEQKILDNRSAVLLKLAEIAVGQERQQLLREAAELARKASQILPGAGDYNLACALSQLQAFDEAKPLLRSALESRPNIRAHALQDPDLIPLWEAHPDLRNEVEAQLPGSLTPTPLSE